MTETFELLTGSDDIRAAFAIWRKALVEEGVWRGNSWWLPEEGVVVGNRNDRADPRLGAFVVLGVDPAGTNVTVQLNEPSQYGNENPLSGVVRGMDGRLHLVRQGVLHKNAQSERIGSSLFAERTGLEPILVRVAGQLARRSWFIVTALDLPAASIRRNIARFVDLCSVARGAEASARARADDRRMEELFGGPESGGETSGEPTINLNKRRRLQGEVWLALHALLEADGRDLLKPRHARGYEVDGVIAIPTGKLLLEIKTGISAADVYAGVGQLTLYPRLLPRLAGHTRVLLLPGAPTEPLIEAVRECGVELHCYQMKNVGETCPAYSGRSRIQEPSFSHSRPRFGCFCGTFSPSRRQIRSTRLWFTDQPAECSSAVTRR